MIIKVKNLFCFVLFCFVALRYQVFHSPFKQFFLMKRKILTAVFGLAALAAFTFSPSSEAGSRKGSRYVLIQKNTTTIAGTQGHTYTEKCRGRGTLCNK
jgi:hypothetical protein